MPGIPSHILMAEEIANKLSPKRDGVLMKSILSSPKFYRLGAVGPDLLFFAADYEDTSHAILGQILSFYDEVIGPFVDLYEEYIKPVAAAIEAVDEGIDSVLDELTCGLTGTIGSEIDSLMDRLIQYGSFFVLDTFSKTINAFDEMQPPIQKGEDEKSWFWFDMLHYRRTGAFLRNMWDLSTTDNQRAYVLGYATHIAADVAGHPYVNAVVGGPYRSHNQRHHFAENILDVWLYDKLRNENLCESELHLKLPHGNEIDELGLLLGVLEGATDAPEDLHEVFAMIHQAMQATFQDPVLPERISSRYLSVEDLNTSHWFLLAALKAMTSGRIPAPPVPGEEELDAINEAIQDFWDNLTHPPAPSPNPPDLCFDFWSDDCDFSIENLTKWLEYLWDTISYIGELLWWVASLMKDLFDILNCTITAPAKTLIRAHLWLIQSALHSAIEELREALVLAALIHPDRDWIHNHPLAKQVTEVGPKSLRDAIAGNYPHRAQSSNEGFLAYPATPVEKPITVACPHSIGETLEDAFSDVGSAALREQYAAAKSPGETRVLEFSTFSGASGSFDDSMGSTIQIARALMHNLLGDSVPPDWNLDADRGYGYKSWKADYSSLAHDETTPVQDTWQE